MPKYVEWDSLDAKIEECLNSADYGFDNDLLNQVFDILSDPSAADVEPVRHGRWIHVTNGRGGFECSLCSGYAASYQSGSDYLSAWCPNCGAKMDKEADDV